MSELPANRVPARTSSKRSRAAEVHNLSEKVCSWFPESQI